MSIGSGLPAGDQFRRPGGSHSGFSGELIMSFLFGCSHKNTTFPMTLRLKNGEAVRDKTHVVCLDCGQEFAYNWDEMRIVRGSGRKSAAAKDTSTSPDFANLHELVSR
jgi:hypothetical protein